MARFWKHIGGVSKTSTVTVAAIAFIGSCTTRTPPILGAAAWRFQQGEYFGGPALKNSVRHPKRYATLTRSPAVLPRTFWRMSSSSAETKKRVLVPIGDDSEEIETCCITDTLVRFGAEVVVASVKPGGDLKCRMSRGIHIVADTTIEDASKEDWDVIALPGGMPGAEHLRDSEVLIELLKKQDVEGRMYGAICASPAVALAPHGLIKPGSTCYPAPPLRKAIENASDDAVVVQGNLVTSQGPGTSLNFALQLGEELYGKQKADSVAEALLVKR